MTLDAADEAASNFCTNVLSIYEVKIVNKQQIGSILLLVALLYMVTSVALLIVTRMQSYLARRGDDYISQSVANVMIFPVFINILIFNTFINALVGVAYLFFSYAINDQHSDASIVVFSFVWGFQHFLLEGVAFLLMGKGLGMNSAKLAFWYALLWGAVTTAVQGIINANFTNTISFLFTLIWEAILLAFYFLLWTTPQKHLFRRPAVILYAKFWTIFRAISMLSRILVFIPATLPIGNCMYAFGSLVVFAAFEPLVLYYTLLQDSRWWQGLNISQGKRTQSAEAIRSPLEGVDLNARSAQVLAYNVDAIGSGRRGGGMVKLLNFAYITLDKSSLLGSGSFSKVYRGSYKQDSCAIKLIFTVDLTTDIIRRVCAEAEILSNFKHKNIVHIYGVAVLPPSVCILLELCAFGSLADVVRGLCIDPIRCLSKESGTQSPTSFSSSSFRNRDTTKSVSKFCLTTADRLFLAMGCARGVAALHSHSRDLCHRDIKSFNFLVDNQFNAKLADLELGVTEQIRRGGSRERVIFEKKRKSSGGFLGFGGRSRYGKSAFGISVSSSLESDMDGGAGVATAGVLAADEFLANWAAPEVIVNGVHTQASDVYSLALVLWEIITGQVPFNEESKQDDIRGRVLAGDRPALPALCYQQHEQQQQQHNSNPNGPWNHYAAIIERGWQHEALARPSASEILSELECMWRAVGNSVVFDSEVSIDLGSDESLSTSPIMPQPSRSIARLAGSHHAPQTLMSEAVNRQAVMRTISAVQYDPALQSLDTDQGAWIVVSAEAPHIILKCNANWSSMTGFIPDEVLGSALSDVMTGTLTETNTFAQFSSDISTTLFGNATNSAFAVESELLWHCNLTLYKSPDFDDEIEATSDAGAEATHGTKEHRRRSSFQQERHALFSLHGFPIRKKCSKLDDVGNEAATAEIENNVPAGNDVPVVSNERAARESVTSVQDLNLSNRLVRALTLGGGTPKASSNPKSADASKYAIPITMIAILYSEIRSAAKQTADMKENLIRASLQSAFASVTRTSFTGTQTHSSSNPSLSSKTSANASSNANQNAPNGHRRSFQLKPRGSFSSFRSAVDSPGSPSTVGPLLALLGEISGQEKLLRQSNISSECGQITSSVSRTTSNNSRKAGDSMDSSSRFTDTSAPRQSIFDMEVNSPFHGGPSSMVHEENQILTPTMLPTLDEEDERHSGANAALSLVTENGEFGMQYP